MNVKLDTITQLLTFIKSDNNCVTFLHVTNEKENAINIIKNGFNYIDNFHKTTDEISPVNEVTLSWVCAQRKAYGQYIIVIQIDRSILKNRGGIDELSFNEHLISDDEFIYTLYKYYVKGYIDENTGLIIKNSEFNSKFNPISLNK